MNYSFSLTGAVIPVIKDFKIGKDTKVTSGKLVYMDENGIVNTEKNGKVLGVCAENHSGEKDILNARANSEAVRVDITLGGVYRMPLPILTACEDATATSFACESGLFDTAAKGTLVLVEKAADSTNADKVGAERSITSVAVSGGKVTFTLSEGGTACIGDRYAFMPEAGFMGCPDDEGTGFSALQNGEGAHLTVITSDKNTLTLEAVLDGKLFN